MVLQPHRRRAHQRPAEQQGRRRWHEAEAVWLPAAGYRLLRPAWLRAPPHAVRQRQDTMRPRGLSRVLQEGRAEARRRLRRQGIAQKPMD